MQTRKLCTPKVNLKSKQRLSLYLNEEDAKKAGGRGRWEAEVTDIDTQIRYVLRGCSCGIAYCMCDAYIAKTLPPLS